MQNKKKVKNMYFVIFFRILLSLLLAVMSLLPAEMGLPLFEIFLENYKNCRQSEKLPAIQG